MDKASFFRNNEQLLSNVKSSINYQKNVTVSMDKVFLDPIFIIYIKGSSYLRAVSISKNFKILDLSQLFVTLLILLLCILE